MMKLENISKACLTMNGKISIKRKQQKNKWSKLIKINHERKISGKKVFALDQAPAKKKSRSRHR